MPSEPLGESLNNINVKVFQGAVEYITLVNCRVFVSKNGVASHF